MAAIRSTSNELVYSGCAGLFTFPLFSLACFAHQVDVPGLAMSRSIGDDVSQTVGVISVPEIMEHEIQPSDQFVIWASDGVWEFISSQEAVNIVHPFRGNLHQAAARLVEESCTRWKREEEVIDDVTWYA